MMFIDRILYPIASLGPGKRLVIWTKGCSKHCIGCANPELWDSSKSKSVSSDDIIKMITNINSETHIDGITFSGGDPLEQADDILYIIKKIKPLVSDVLVYTGYYYKDIQNTWDQKLIEKIRKYISVLIDGPYVETLNDNKCSLIGSTNQNIIYFDQSLKSTYENYTQNGRMIQNLYMGDKFISVGIHNRTEKKA